VNNVRAVAAGRVLATFSESGEHAARVAAIIGAGFAFTPRTLEASAHSARSLRSRLLPSARFFLPC
jgi:hypothetical protein